jgi:hypothetical protein
LLIWLPLALWLALEVYVLVAGLLTSCKPQIGGDRAETVIVLFFLSFPASVVLGVLELPLAKVLSDPCSTTEYVAQWFACCGVGFVQWYFVLRGVDWVMTKLYRRLRMAF